MSKPKPSDEARELLVALLCGEMGPLPMEPDASESEPEPSPPAHLSSEEVAARLKRALKELKERYPNLTPEQRRLLG